MARLSLVFILVAINVLAIIDSDYRTIMTLTINLFILSVLALCESIDKSGRK